MSAPRVLMWLARLALSPGHREWMLGDLEEDYARIRSERGAARAAAWLVSETARNAAGRIRTGIDAPGARRAGRMMATDLRYAIRLMRQAPGFTLTIVVTLALGIGANTAIFSVIDALLFKPLPYPFPDRLYAVVLANDKPQGFAFWPYPKYMAFAREQQEFELTAAYSATRITIEAGGQAQRVEAEAVTSSYFSIFGLTPALGRFFSPDDDRVPAANAVAVIGDGLWRDTFNADQATVGRAITIAGRAYTVVGVMPPSYHGQNGNAQLWLPVMMAEHFMYKGATTGGSSWWLRPVVRLKPELTLAAAAARMPGLSARVGRVDPSRMRTAMREGRELFQLLPFRDTKVDPQVRRSFIVLLAAVGCVLLIACANTASLLLGRAVTRQGEFAVRRALGASTGDVARQVAIESLVLAAVSGAAAFFVATAVLNWLTAVKPMNAVGFWSQYARTFDFFAVRLDARVGVFNTVVALVVGLLFAWLPARQAAGGAVNDALKQRAGGGVPRVRTRSALVLAETAFSVMLLAGAGLTARSFRNATAADLGFQPDGVLSTSIAIQGRKPVAFYREMLDRLNTIPGVQRVALANSGPLSGGTNVGAIEIEGRDKNDRSIRAGLNVVTPDFFRTLGVSLLAGRSLTDDDRADTPRTAVISRAFAQSAWPGQSAIGKRIRHPFRVAFGDPASWTTIVGVADDVVYGALEDPKIPMLYLCAWQPLGSPAAISLAPDTIILAGATPAGAIPAIRQIVHELDPASPLYDSATMNDRAASVTARYRYSSAMMGSLALLALLLAAIGTYGVIAWSVASRTHEIGIRMALGARPGEVLTLVLAGGLKVAAAGVALGLAGAVLAARPMTALLYGVTPQDPVTFASIAAIMIGTAGIASYLPARRAMRVEPTRALRRE